MKFDLQAAKASAAQVVSDRIVNAAGSASNLFDGLIGRIADNDQLTDDQKAAALEELLTNATAFVNSELGGHQPLAIGAGSPQGQPTTEQVNEALRVIGNALTARGSDYEHQAKLIRNALAPKTDPNFVESDNNGQPKQVAALQKEIAAYRDDHDLLDEVVTLLGHTPVASDEHYPLSKWSKTITNSVNARVDPKTVVSKADLASAVDAAKEKVEEIKGGLRPGLVLGKDEALDAVEDIAKLAQ